MPDRETLLTALAPVLDIVRTIDPASPDAAQRLETALPLGGPVVQSVRRLVREGVAARWLCDRENAGVRFSRVLKAVDGGLSVDAVHMSGPGGAHVHPNGEIDLCFAVEGDARFDGRPEGWTVYAPNTWHVPTVRGGVMDILYFLPGGAIGFGPRPDGSTSVGEQA